MSDEQNKATPSIPDHPHPQGSAIASDASEASSEIVDATSYTVEDGYGNSPEPYMGETGSSNLPAVVAAEPPPPVTPPPPASPDGDEDDDDDEGMLRMSFLDHLEELRSRLIRALAGLALAFFACLYFSEKIWYVVQQPAEAALKSLGYTDATLVFTSPMESFSIIWMKLPLLISLFVASPWVLYQTWAFIAPGLYKRERRLAVPFILCTAGLFILGGLFAYFVAFRFGLAFLLGIGQGVGVRPMIKITEYFDIFVNVILGVAVVFELPVLIFFLTLLRIASPRFLLANSRYAILGIVILAAIITPTPDVFNLMLFSVPMVVLFFIGVFASYLLVLNREGKKFPWGLTIAIFGGILLIIAGAIYIGVTKYGFHLIPNWPFLVR